MKIAVYPGSFDPITNGHLDILARAVKLFDKVIISVARNSSKSPLFSDEVRMELLHTAIGKRDNVEIDSFQGLLVDYARSKKATAIVRGLRVISDFEYEFQMALMNRRLDEEVETVFLMPNEKYTYLSSSIVREIARLGGDVSDFVPKVVIDALKKNLKT